MSKEHIYKLTLEWTGNTGSGTSSYTSYERSHSFRALGKTALLGSSDPAFRGDPTKWNPEELMLSSLASCHMLWYLHFCANAKIIVQSYEDTPTATLSVEANGSGKFIRATLNPTVDIDDPAQIPLATELHEQAHKFCFIAKSINFPVEIKPNIRARDKR